MSQNKDRDLHSQIEDLLMALSDLQRQQADLSRELQREREEREEDQALARSMLEFIKETNADAAPSELLNKAEEKFATVDSARRTSIDQTKHQLRDDLERWKNMYSVEAGRCLDLTRRIDEQEQEAASLREQLREARGRIQDGYRDRQRLERTVRELRSIKTKTPDTPPESYGSPTSDHGESFCSGGLRELKLARSASQKSTQPATFNKRSSSLGLQNVLSTENNKPPGDEALLLELVNAKTAEAVAKQELEEVKAKLDSLRKMIGGQGRGLTRSSTTENRNSLLGVPPNPGLSKTYTEAPTTSGGFFSGWGR
jgi:DNA repair exonuclease SbcCD ATPase subunit